VFLTALKVVILNLTTRLLRTSYGLSKSLGEIIDDKNLTLRTSIIGPELKDNGEGLFSWFVKQTGRESVGFPILFGEV
jgi:hypothetical protein